MWSQEEAAMNTHQPTRHVQAREAKAKLSELLDAAERGEETVITRHGKPVARIVREEPQGEKRVNNPGSPYHGMTFFEMLMAFPGPLEIERDEAPVRDLDL
jgi:prevent-host-death family protein